VGKLKGGNKRLSTFLGYVRAQKRLDYIQLYSDEFLVKF
jgi:hypothetical protein